MRMEDGTAILLVEHDPALREKVGKHLRRHGLAVSEAEGMGAARRLMQQQHFDLTVLALAPPAVNALALCRTIAMRGGMPVILLAENKDPVQLAAGFGSGADDYLVKPFSTAELYLRINAILRRAGRQASYQPALAAGRYRFADWLLDTETRELLDGSATAIPLSSAEYRLLAILLAAPNQVLSRERLLELSAGGTAEVFDRAIDTQVSRLRKKIETDPRQPRLLKTVWGKGYLLAATVERT